MLSKKENSVYIAALPQCRSWVSPWDSLHVVRVLVWKTPALRGDAQPLIRCTDIGCCILVYCRSCFRDVSVASSSAPTSFLHRGCPCLLVLRRSFSLLGDFPLFVLTRSLWHLATKHLVSVGTLVCFQSCGVRWCALVLQDCPAREGQAQTWTQREREIAVHSKNVHHAHISARQTSVTQARLKTDIFKALGTRVLSA